MPSIINSDDGVVSGTSGLKSTGGNDGLLNIQSNGSTVVAVTGSGISVTGTVSQTGVSTFAAGTVSAPSITFTGDTNTGIFSPGADQVSITTGGTQRVAVDASGNVGIGVTPSAWNSSWKANQVGSYGAVSVLTNQTNLTNNLFYNASNNWVYLNTNAAAVYAQVGGQHIFQSAASGTAGNNVTTLTSVLQVDRTKTLALENASPQSGTGITFPATQSASSDANTLDDYEEGTWTPTYTTSNGNATVTYSDQSGTYTKIGRVVYFSFQVNMASVTSAGTGNIRIGGLPFTIGTNWGRYLIQTNDVTFNTGYNQGIYLYPVGSSTYMQLLGSSSGGGWSVVSPTDWTISASSIFTAQGFYSV